MALFSGKTQWENPPTPPKKSPKLHWYPVFERPLRDEMVGRVEDLAPQWKPNPGRLPSLKPTICTWKLGIGKGFSCWKGFLIGAKSAILLAKWNNISTNPDLPEIGKGGFPYISPPFGVRSVREVARIWPVCMISMRMICGLVHQDDLGDKSSTICLEWYN